ncbi:MAG TPA: oxidoreductase, partial [Acidobacteriaceae bacterium]|nr:oxidoreductase [Acidobacteriaceae bacterium]
DGVSASQPRSGWTLADMPSQSGRRALITGANSGIGFYTALELARAGAHVVLACRDRSRGDAAMARIRTAVPMASGEVVLLDLASLASVRTAAEIEVARGTALDLLINNAGIYAPKKRLETADGFELQFGTNVLGHFALTALLLPALVRAAEGGDERPRVVTIASIAHKRAQLNFDDLQSTTNYSPSKSYGQSKLANLMLAFELDRRLRAADEPKARVRSVAAHPGVANTNLFEAGDFQSAEQAMRRAITATIGTLLNSEAQGALPTLFAATAEDAVSGGYYGPQGFQEMRGGDVGLARVSSQARDEIAATRLWRECERLTGITLR